MGYPRPIGAEWSDAILPSESHEDFVALLERARAGDTEAETICIRANMGLVFKMARSLCKPGEDTSDLVSIGVIVLYRCLKLYNPARFRFSSYACRALQTEMLRQMNRDAVVVVNEYAKETLKKQQTSKNGRLFSSAVEAGSWKRRRRVPVDRLADMEAGDTAFNSAIMSELRENVAKLPPPISGMVYQRYISKPPRGTREIAALAGCSMEHVRREIKNGIQTLRRVYMGDDERARLYEAV